MRAERLDALAQEIVDPAGVFGHLGDGGVAMLAHARLEGRESALERLAHAVAMRADIGRDELRRRPNLVLEFRKARDDTSRARGLALLHGRGDGPALAGDDFLEGGELFRDQSADALAALQDPRAHALAAFWSIRAPASSTALGDLRAGAFAVFQDLRGGAFAVLEDSRAGAFDVLGNLRAGALASARDQFAGLLAGAETTEAARTLACVSSAPTRSLASATRATMASP